MSFTLTAIILSFALACVAWTCRLRETPLRPRLLRFPGPKPSLIVGHALLIPKERIWYTLAEFAKEHGPFTALRVFHKSLLVLSTVRANRELLEYKSALYSNRPLDPIIQIAGFDKGVVLEHDPARLRQARKLLNLVLNKNRIQDYREAFEYHVNVLLKNLLQHPDDLYHHIFRLASGVALEVSHGYRVTSQEDGFVQKANTFGENFSRATLTGSISTIFPFLAQLPAFLPGMGWKRRALEWRSQYFSMAEEGHQMVKEEVAKGIARPSLTYTGLVEGQGKFTDECIMFTATQVYSGGADTVEGPVHMLHTCRLFLTAVQTASILQSFVLFMVLHPDEQKRAQDEIDSVVNFNRLPSISDRKNLPYTDAILTEVARLRPPIPTLWREAAQDDVHNGHFITKGTTILINFWAMLHDEAVYTDAESLKPERWIGKERDPDTHPLEFGFGFGKRICPGRYLAEEVLFIAIARILAVFTISYAHDADGSPVIPSGELVNGGITHPKPFQCSIRLRNPHIRELW